jgi:hypothetical protein
VLPIVTNDDTSQVADYRGTEPHEDNYSMDIVERAAEVPVVFSRRENKQYHCRTRNRQVLKKHLAAPAKSKGKASNGPENTSTNASRRQSYQRDHDQKLNWYHFESTETSCGPKTARSPGARLAGA